MDAPEAGRLPPARPVLRASSRPGEAPPALESKGQRPPAARVETQADAPGAAAQPASAEASPTPAPSPRITHLNPGVRRILDEVLVIGQDLGAATQVTVGGVPAPFRVLDAGRILMLVPPGAAQGRITVRTPGGTGESPVDLRIDPAAPVPAGFTGFIPARPAPRTWVSLCGEKLGWCEAVLLEGRAVPFWVAGSDRILVWVPQTSAGGPVQLQFGWRGPLETPALVLAEAPPGPLAIRSVTRSSKHPGVVQILGTGLGSVRRATLGGEQLTLRLHSDTLARAVLSRDPELASYLRLESADGACAYPLPDPDAPPPSVIAMSPDRVGILKQTLLIGYHLQDAFAVTVGGLPAAFERVEARMLRVRIPAAARDGKVVVDTRGGRWQCDQDLRIDRTPPSRPAFESFVPPRAAPGAWVSLRGTGLEWCDGAALGGAPVPFQVVDGRRVLVQAPADGPGGPVTLRFPWGETLQTAPLELSGAGPGRPELRSALQDQDQPRRLVIRGTGLGAVRRVTLGGAELPIFLVNDTWIWAQLPADPGHPDLLRLETPEESFEFPFAFPGLEIPEAPPRPVPAIAYLVGGAARILDEVKVAGQHFRGASRVEVGGRPAPFRVVGENELLLLVPPDARDGRVRVITREGEAESPEPLRVTADPPDPPAFGRFVPARARPGSWVSVVGTKLDWVRAVTCCGRAVPFEVVQPDRILVRAPALSAPESLQLVIDRLEPLETGLLDPAGPAPPPLAVTALVREPKLPWVLLVTGTSLGTLRGATLGGTPVQVEVRTDRLARVSLPEDAKGGGILRLQSRDQSWTGAVPEPGAAVDLRPAAAASGSGSAGPVSASPGAPVIERMVPDRGGPGIRVLLEGRGLARAEAVQIGGREVPFTVDAEGRIEVVVPRGAEPGQVRVRTPEGETAAGTPFLVQPVAAHALRITDLRPGASRPLDVISVDGDAFQAVTRVTVGGVQAPFRLVDPETLRVLVPPGARSGRVMVSAGAGRAMSAQVLHLTDGSAPAPAFDRFVPAQAGPDTWVSLRGSKVGWCTAVTFGGVPVPFRVAGDDRILVRTPSGAGDGPFLLRFPWGEPLTTGILPLDAKAAPQDPPAITQVTEDGSFPGILWVRGTALGSVVRCTLGGAELVSMPFSDTQVLCNLPQGFRGPATVRLETMAGTCESPEPFQLGAAEAPAPAALEAKAPAHPALRLDSLYLTQATQRADGSVPLVAGRDAWLRAFPVADALNRARPRLVIRILDRDGNELMQAERELDPPGVPLRADPDTLRGSWNVPVPGALVRAGNVLRCTLVPDPSAPDQAPRELPPVPLQVEENLPPLRVTLIPILVQGRLGRVADSQRTLASWGQRAELFLPTGGLDLKLGPVFVAAVEDAASSRELAEALLDELRIKRLLDPPEPGGLRTYYGVFSQFSMPDDQIRGLGQVGQPGRPHRRVAVGWDAEPEQGGKGYFGTFVHEIGHTLGLDHPEPGTTGQDGSRYPHAGKVIGAPGFDVRTGRPVPAAQFKSFMSYDQPAWVSDFDWEEMIAFQKQDRAGLEREDKGTGPARAPGPGQPEALLIQGRIWNGKLRLRPALRIPAGNATPPAAGPYLLRGLDAAGRTLLEVPFGTADAPDAPDGVIAFAVPLVPGLERGLATLRVLGPAGAGGGPESKAELLDELHPRPVPAHPRPCAAFRVRGETVAVAWDDQAYAMVAVQDAGTGETLAVAWKSPLELETQATDLLLLCSDGIRTTVRQLRVP